MTSATGLLGKFTRAFWLQVGFITLAAILGIFLAKLLIEENLVRSAILDEAEYFWKRYRGGDAPVLPDTKNLTGYFDPGRLPPMISAGLPTEPGFYEFSDPGNRLVLYLDRRFGETLYLVYYRGQVDALVLYYGLFPLLVVLTILYLTLWFAYRFSRRTLSPLTRLAQHINDIDLGRDQLSLRADEPGFANDDEIAVLANALAHLGERLDAFISRERNFTRNASPEFRTPLTVINVAADMMLLEEKLPPGAQKSLLKIKRAVYDMQNLTDVFLMLAREDAGSITRRRVNVNEVVREQIESSRHLRENKTIEVRLREKAQLDVMSSETVIAVLLGNLIRNASLHTDRGEIDIEIDRDELTITDSGPGIPDARLDSIFEPFSRLNENAAGYGIGLTIVKRLCDRFGWKIEVCSEAERGARFRLDFAAAA